ncbi:MAG: molybdopterin molybdotransferase MoeA, partial [Gammaproteobacteria bacterium]
KLLPRQCIRIFTGAIVPNELDTVVMQEQVTKDRGQILFPPGISAHQHVRAAGEDLVKGIALLDAPKKLNPADIGLLGSAGIYQLEVKRRLKIAFFSTGDELVAIGQPIAPGQIYDSNRYMLKSLLADESVTAVDMGVIPDDKKKLQQALVAASENHDVIITTGGASVGEADFVKEILQTCGHISFWKLAVKPGKPLAFGTLGQAYFFGLPGNPVSVITAFQQVVKPALEQLSGAPPVKPLTVQAVCLDDLKKSPGRQEFMRGVLTQTNNGEFRVKSAGRQGSHILSSLSRANCYIVLPASNGGVKSGDTVSVEPFGIELSTQ